MGSLGTDTNISDITYVNVYTWSSNQVRNITNPCVELKSCL